MVLLKIDVDNGSDLSSGESLQFKISGTAGLTINDSNVRIPTKLGINGAAPQSPLDVIANSSGYAVDIRGRSSDDTSEIHFCGNDSSPNYAVIGITTTGGGQFNLSVAGSQRVGITSAGQLRNQGTYNGSSSTSNDFPGLNINTYKVLIVLVIFLVVLHLVSHQVILVVFVLVY